ncbi:Smr/MutS family protein [Tatumella saanichensis]|uniref:Smr/MutS family protein n=1 Tax=Tatumella saanichensis TaxID=480813 RepID=UPI0004A2DBD5|nr:Smr/MutS family protein [Tatumella saanichensis]
MTDSDDHALFLTAMNDVSPLKQTQQPYQPPRSRKCPQPRSSEEQRLPLDPLVLLDTDESPLFRRHGVQPGVMEKLRRGGYRLDGSLSVLHLTPEQTRHALLVFLAEVQRRGGRNVLIVHGKPREADGPANVRRSYLVNWLSQLEEVATFCVAARKNGGSGALYVALSKSEAQRDHTRELHGGRAGQR